MAEIEEAAMASTRADAKLDIRVPREKLAERPVERLIELCRKQRKTVNYLVIDAIFEYLKRQEPERRFVKPRIPSSASTAELPVPPPISQQPMDD